MSDTISEDRPGGRRRSGPASTSSTPFQPSRRRHGRHAHGRIARAAPRPRAPRPGARDRLLPTRGRRAGASTTVGELPGRAPAGLAGQGVEVGELRHLLRHASISTMPARQARSSGRIRAWSSTSASRGAAPVDPEPPRAGREAALRGQPQSRLLGAARAGAGGKHPRRRRPRDTEVFPTQAMPHHVSYLTADGACCAGDAAGVHIPPKELRRAGGAAAGHRRGGVGADARRHRGAPRAADPPPRARSTRSRSGNDVVSKRVSVHTPRTYQRPPASGRCVRGRTLWRAQRAGGSKILSRRTCHSRPARRGHAAPEPGTPLLRRAVGGQDRRPLVCSWSRSSPTSNAPSPSSSRRAPGRELSGRCAQTPASRVGLQLEPDGHVVGQVGRPLPSVHTLRVAEQLLDVVADLVGDHVRLG